MNKYISSPLSRSEKYGLYVYVAIAVVFLATLLYLILTSHDRSVIRHASAQPSFQPGRVLTAAELNAAFATAAITGGTINGAAIGGINPSTGKFSSLTTTSPLGPAYGGTGVANNSSSTLTLTGTFPLALTTSASTSLLLPNSGTVTALGNSATGTGNIVRATAPTIGTTTLTGVTTATTLNVTGAATVGSFATAPAVTRTPTTYTVQNTDTGIIANAAGTLTLTLPVATASSGRILIVRTIAAQAVGSASANVVPLVGGSAVTPVVAATAGKWVLLQSDGTNWQVMMGN